MAVFNGITGISAFLGPLIGGLLYEITKGGSEWMQISGISVVVGLLLTFTAIIFSQSSLRTVINKRKGVKRIEKASVQ